MKPEDLKPIPKERYYNLQLLQVEDFLREQNFHIAYRELQTRLLYTPGILLGLDVELDSVSGQARISRGLAIDGSGRLIILVNGVVFEDNEVSLENGAFTLNLTDEKYRNKIWLLTIDYGQAAEDSSALNQWKQLPRLMLLDASAAAEQIILAKIEITGNAPIAYNLDSGVRIPASLVNLKNIDAGKITSGTFDIKRIPDIPSSKISESIDASKIPYLSAEKINSGVLKIEQIPEIPTSKITGKLNANQLPDIAPEEDLLPITIDKVNLNGEETFTLSWTDFLADEIHIEYIYENELLKRNLLSMSGPEEKSVTLVAYQTGVYTLKAYKSGKIQTKQFTVQVIPNEFQYLKSLRFSGVTLSDALTLCLNRYRLSPLTDENIEKLAEAAKRAGYSRDEALNLLKINPALAAPVITNFSNDKRDFFIQWNLVSDADGYELEIIELKGKKRVKATDGKTKETTITFEPSLPSGIYQLHIRTIVGSLRGQWSEYTSLNIPERHYWSFDENAGVIAHDAIGDVNGTLSNVLYETPGYLGRGAVRLTGEDNSFVNLGKKVGQFGRSDFTVALWFKTNETYKYFDIIGNRTCNSHGNFFCLKMTGNHESRKHGMIVAEVDENESGANYIAMESDATGLNDGKWHHVAVVRSEIFLKLYVDGVLSAEASIRGIANIINGNDFILGWSKGGATDKSVMASYDELYVYSEALSADEISNLFKAKDAGQSDEKYLFFDGQAYAEVFYPELNHSPSYRETDNDDYWGFTMEASVYLTTESEMLPILYAILDYQIEYGQVSLCIKDGYLSTIFPAYSKVSTTDKKLPLNRWVSLASVYINGYIFLYMDGENIAIDNLIDTGMNFNRYFLGKDDSRYFTGFIREVRVWRKPRNQEQILKYTNVLLGDYSQSLISEGLGAYWQLRDGEGTSAKESIKGNDFQLHNTSWTNIPKK